MNDTLRRLLPGGGGLLVAVSGGRDSMVLADAVRRLARRRRLKVLLAHVHHGLRGPDADADEALVKAAGRSWGIPVVTARVRTKSHRRRYRLSLEEAARQLRYRALDRLRRACGADLIVTAHHADDQAETVFLRATRGAHVRGLAAILPVLEDPPVARPLLEVPRLAIETYLERRRIPFRDDRSNTDLTIRRNLVRKRLLGDVSRELQTDLAALLPRLATATRKLTRASKSALDQLEAGMISIEKRVCLLRTTGLEQWPDEVQLELISRFLRRALIEPTNARLATLKALIRLPVGRWRPVGDRGRRVYRERSGLALLPPVLRTTGSISLLPGSACRIPGGRLRISRPLHPPRSIPHDPARAFLDARAVRGKLSARLWRPADRMVPLGMTSHRKVSDLLTDRKVPAFRKPLTPVILAGRRIIWVCGVGLDDRARIRQATTRVLQFSFHSNV